MSMNPGRNETCPCGSGKKYKHCCARKAALRQPSSAEINQLLTLFNSGRHMELEGRACLLLERLPESGLVWKLLCAALQMQGKDALQALRKAAAFLPNDAEMQNSLGNAMQDHRQFDVAVESYRRAIKINPGYAMAYNNLGTALETLGQREDAAASYRRAVKIKPDFAEAHNNLGNLLLGLGQYADAAASCRKAVEIKPDFALAHNNLGNALKDLGQIEEAVACYRQALKTNPRLAEVYSNLGAALHELGWFDEAAASCRKAIEIRPEFALAHNNMGNVLKDLWQLDAAAESYRRALEIQPNYPEASNNLGIVLHALGQFDAAGSSYCHALALAPEYAEAHANASYLFLSLGLFERGWREYAWRSARCVVEQRIKSPLTAACDMLPFTSKDKRILLYHEQGIGDEIFFLRFSRQLRQDARWVGYVSTEKVRGLIERSACVDQVFPRSDEPPAADLILPVGDLPLLLGCYSTAAIPPSLRFPPVEASVATVRQRLGEMGLAGKQLLGVTWRGGLPPVPGRPRTLFKQIGLDVLADAIRDWKGAIVVLQRNPAAGEIEQLRAHVACPVHDFSEYNDDLESMLALLDVLDDYVGVSNANMHLMAGLGKTARVLIPSPAEWRWMVSGEQSPWFPGFALYRQAVEGDWDAALTALTRDLAGF